MDSSLTVARHPRRSTAVWTAALLGGVTLLAACGGDDVDPTDADTGIATEAPADPAATPAASEDPLTGSEP